MTTAIANLPDPPRTLSLRRRLHKRTMPRPFRSFIGLQRNQRNRQWRFRRAISKRVVLRFSAAKRKPPIFIWRLLRLEIRIPIARMHDGQRHPFSLDEGEKWMR